MLPRPRFLDDPNLDIREAVQLVHEGVDLPVRRRLIYHARDYDDAFNTITPWSQIVAERAASPPAPPPRFLEFRVTLDADTIGALDRREVIRAIVANRDCVVRLRDVPSRPP
jgi:hypothetical protein